MTIGAKLKKEDGDAISGRFSRTRHSSCKIRINILFDLERLIRAIRIE